MKCSDVEKKKKEEEEEEYSIIASFHLSDNDAMARRLLIHIDISQTSILEG